MRSFKGLAWKGGDKIKKFLKFLRCRFFFVEVRVRGCFQHRLLLFFVLNFFVDNNLSIFLWKKRSSCLRDFNRHTSNCYFKIRIEFKSSHHVSGINSMCFHPSKFFLANLRGVSYILFYLQQNHNPLSHQSRTGPFPLYFQMNLTD